MLPLAGKAVTGMSGTQLELQLTTCSPFLPARLFRLYLYVLHILNAGLVT